jgi:hypothetical protein
LNAISALVVVAGFSLRQSHPEGCGYGFCVRGAASVPGMGKGGAAGWV